MTKLQNNLLVFMLVLSGPAATHAQDTKTALEASKAETMLLQADKENATLRQQIREAGGDTTVQVASTVPTKSGAPQAGDVYWQGGNALVEVVLPDGATTLAKPGAVVADRWEVVLTNGKASVVPVKGERKNGR